MLLVAKPTRSRPVRTTVLRRLCFLICLALPIGAFADSICEGAIEYLAVGRASVVLVKGPGGLPATYLCDMAEKQNNVEPEACRAMYSTLLAAHAQGKIVRITFNPSITACNEVASWGWATNLNWIIAD
jgi:hypothetical protein